jgi:hypothetical protein
VPDLQVAHAAALAGAYDQIVAQIAALPTDQQAAAQAALDLQNASAQKQLAHVLAEHTPTDATTGLVNTSVAQLNELQAELQRKSAWYRTNSPTGTPVDPAAAHRKDAEHRNSNSLHTAEPTADPTSTPDPATTAASSASTASGTPHDGDDFAKRLRQSNRR